MSEKLTAQDYGMILGCEVMAQVAPGLLPKDQWKRVKLIGVKAKGVLIEYKPFPGMTFDRVKPILRLLLSMTEAERIIAHDMRLEWRDKDSDSFLHNDMKRDSRQTLWLIRQGFDVFNWIEAGLAIDKTKMDKG